MAREITFDAGAREYAINGVAVSFNPTDANFVERLYDTFTELEKSQAEIEKQVEEIGDDGKKMFALASAKDKQMRGYIDKLLGKGMANKLFRDMNCYALGDVDKVPVWVNLMLAIAMECADEMTASNESLSESQQRFSAKYDALMKKYGKKPVKRKGSK